MNNAKKFKKPGISFVITITITLCTVLASPVLISHFSTSSENNRDWVLIVLFPIYALLSSYLSYRIYSDQKGLAWILIILVWLSFFAQFMLI
ncbi:MAG: hypothetical protein RR061_03125 [Muribaculaceae bacterium]